MNQLVTISNKKNELKSKTNLKIIYLLTSPIIVIITKSKIMKKNYLTQLSNPETIIKSQDDLEPIESNKLHQFSEFNIEIERITMEQEDRASQMYEDSIFQRKFKQKDTVVPLKHNILTTNIFFNNPVQEN